MPPLPLTNFEIKKHYQNEPKFNGVYSRNNLPKIKDGAHELNLDEYKLIVTHWIALYVNDDNVTFNSFGVKHIPRETRKCLNNEYIRANIYGIEAKLQECVDTFVFYLLILC